MTRIGVSELRRHAHRYLDEVLAGQTVEITHRKELVALLVAPTPAQTARERLMFGGGLRPRTGPFVLPRLRVASERTEDVLDDLCDDR